MERYNKIATAAFPWLLAATLASMALVPRQVGAGLTSALGLVLAGAGALAGVSIPRRLNSASRVLLGASLATIAWFAITSTRAINPAVSFVGMLGQHNGTALLIAGAAWLFAGVAAGTERTLRLTVRVIAVSGAAFALAAFIEMLVSGTQRTQGFSAGLFENSSSLGQYLAISALAAITWALTEKDDRLRWIGWAIVATCGIGIVASSSRTGMLALAVGVALAYAAAKLPGGKRGASWLAAALALAPLVVTGVLVAASTGAMGTAARSAVAIVGTDRDAIWNAAASRIAVSPVVGEGLQQFSAWIVWSTAGGTPTTDPHNAVLALVLGGGVVGLALAGLAWAALSWETARVASESRSVPVALVMLAPAALLASSLVGWAAPVAVMAAAALAGTGLGIAAGRSTSLQDASSKPKSKAASRKRASSTVASPPADPARTPWDTATSAGLALLAAAAVGAGVWVFSAVPSQLAFARNPQPAELAALYRRWPDPAFASVAINGLIPASGAGDAAAQSLASELIDASAQDARWRVDLTGSQLLVVRTLYGTDAAGFERFAAIAEKGSSADPGSGLWDVLSALEADRLGLADEAASYARQALEFELDAQTRTAMESLAAR